MVYLHDIPPEITIATVVSVYHTRVGRSPTPAGNGPRSAGTAKPGSRRGLDGAFMAIAHIIYSYCIVIII
jgi:hypothetical protein